MTYFHRRMSTIIGAKAFHGPVRDGKEWDHLAMVVKRNRVRASLWGLSRESGKKRNSAVMRVGVPLRAAMGADLTAAICTLGNSQRDFQFV